MKRALRQISLNEFLGTPTKAGPIDTIVAQATSLASMGSFNDGLAPFRNEDGELVYLPSQGLKAAVHGREDAAAGLIIQIEQLKIVRSIRRLCVTVLALAAYIAYRVS
jgi:hypothetical protein